MKHRNLYAKHIGMGTAEQNCGYRTGYCRCKSEHAAFPERAKLANRHREKKKPLLES